MPEKVRMFNQRRVGMIKGGRDRAEDEETNERTHKRTTMIGYIGRRIILVLSEWVTRRQTDRDIVRENTSVRKIRKGDKRKNQRQNLGDDRREKEAGSDRRAARVRLERRLSATAECPRQTAQSESNSLEKLKPEK